MTFSRETIDEIDQGKEREDMKKIEAVLFISGRYLTVQDIITYTDLNPILIKELIGKLREKYEVANSAIEILYKKGEGSEMWKMDVKPDYAGIVNKIATGSSEFTKAEQETLAIIAYKQPIKQSVVIKIRGNKAYDHISKFIDLGLLRKKKIGHTNELSLSEEFYDYFRNSDEESNESEKEDLEA